MGEAMRKILLVPIDAGLLLTKIAITALFSVAGYTIYIAGGLALIVTGACLFFGLVTGDGVQRLVLASAKLLAMIAGASALIYVLHQMLIRLRTRIECRESS